MTQVITETGRVSTPAEVVARFLEELPNRGNLGAADELFAPDYEWRVPYSPNPLRGPESVKETYASRSARRRSSCRPGARRGLLATVALARRRHDH